GEALHTAGTANVPDNLSDVFVTESGQYLTGKQANLIVKGVPGVLDATELERINRKGEQYAVQEPETGAIFQRQPGEIGGAGGERGRVEPGQQGQEIAVT